MVVRCERRGSVGVLTIDRPEVHNAVDGAVTEAMTAALDELEADAEIAAVVITGAGERAFCAGRDLRSIALGTGGSTSLSEAGFAGVTKRGFPKVLLAAVNGLAYAGGLELCLACDLIVAEEHATFALSEVKRGIAAGAGGLVRLPRRLPAMLASEMVLLGEPIDAPRAYAMGLVNRLVPRGTSVDVAVDLARGIAENGPLAVRFSKRVLWASADFGASEVEADAAPDHVALMQTDDVREGIQAFAEKRRPRWTGR